MRGARHPQARSAGRRDAILEAALHSFCTAGFDATTMDEIRRSAGASIGSIYHHFSSKEELAAALYLKGIRSYQTGFHDALDGTRTAEQGVRAMVTYHLRWVDEHSNWARYLLQMRKAEAVAAIGPEIRQANRGFVERLEAWLAPHVQAGAIRRMPPDLLLAALLGPAMEFSRHHLAGRTTTTIKRATKTLSATTWAALAG